MDRHFTQYLLGNLMFSGMGCMGMNGMSYMNSGYGGYGMGFMNSCFDYSGLNDNEIMGYSLGVGAFQTVNASINAISERVQLNRAIGQTVDANMQKSFKDALKVLGLENVDVTTINYETISNAVTIQETSDLYNKLNEPVKTLTDRKSTLETEKSTAESELDELRSLVAPGGNVGNPAKMIKEWENYKTATNSDTNLDTTQKTAKLNKADAAIEELKALQTVWNEWNETSGTKRKELGEIDSKINAAETERDTKKEELEQERTQAAETAKNLLPIIQGKANKANNSDLDNADGCGLSRMFGHKVENFDSEDDVKDVTMADVRKLIHQYRKAKTKGEQDKITTWLKAGNHYAAYIAAANGDTAKLNMLLKIKEGTALTRPNLDA